MLRDTFCILQDAFRMSWDTGCLLQDTSEVTHVAAKIPQKYPNSNENKITPTQMKAKLPQLTGLEIFEKVSRTPSKYLYLHRSVSISKEVSYYLRQVPLSQKKYLPSQEAIIEPFGSPSHVHPLGT